MADFRNMKENLLMETDRLHKRNLLSGTAGQDYYEPGLMEYLDKSDGAYDETTGNLMLRFEVRGTRYEGRTEQIENLYAGVPIQTVRDAGNVYNHNNFTFVYGKKRKNIGNMPAELCNVIAPLYDAGKLTILSTVASYVEPISKRNRHAKQAVLFVELKAHLETGTD